MNRFIIILFCYFLCPSIAEAHPGVGIVMDGNGNVFYTDLTHVWKISPDGERSIAVRNVHTHELYLDVNGDLYGEHEWYEGEATDKWGNYVWCLSKDGVLEKSIPDVEGFLDNDTLVRDMEGNSYWEKKSGDYQILMRETSNGQNSKFTKHHFKDIRWTHFSKNDKNLYVVDKLEIKKVSPSGNVTLIADDLKETKPPFEGVADRHYIFGIWTDKDINVYVAVYGASKIKKIDADGKITTVFESESGWSPCGGLIAPDGTQWIMEFSENNKTRVVKIDAFGARKIYGD
ncbi:hypothetical protein DHD05_15005 [Arenibacter sp. N53]|uniref:hypothetical protein n=1 Tax=Arenibacter TaxID=178469 RepID=UPI000CD41E43|nr:MULTISPECIES: hypothetical protein [Arenibacter]MCM4152900.1 hypothetical protein [Arenibacter sp. N53]